MPNPATEVIHRCERGLRRGLEATLGNIPVPEAAWEQTLAPVRLGGIGLRSPSTIQSAARLASLVNTRERALALGASPEHLREDFEVALGDMSPNCSGFSRIGFHTPICVRVRQNTSGMSVHLSVPVCLPFCVHTIPRSYY